MMQAASSFFHVLYIVGPAVSLAALVHIMRRAGFVWAAAVAPVVVVLALMLLFALVNVFVLDIGVYPLMVLAGLAPAAAIVLPVTLVVLALSGHRVGAAHA